MAMLCSCDDVPTPSNFAEPVLFRIHRMPIGFLRCNQERSLHGNGKGAANGPILQNIQLQACINEDQFHFGTLYKTKLEIFENC
jgi:hypothetical protein